MAENPQEITTASAPAALPIRGYYFFCPKCETPDAERIRLGVGTPKADGTPQDRYRCAEAKCGQEFEDDAWVKAPIGQATIGDAFKQ